MNKTNTQIQMVERLSLGDLKKLQRTKVKDTPKVSKKFTIEEALEYYSTTYPNETWKYEEERNVCISSKWNLGSMLKSIGLMKVKSQDLKKNGYKHSDIYGKPKTEIKLRRGEILKDIPESDYKCTSFGRIFNSKGTEIFKTKSYNGYYHGNIVVKGKLINTTAQRVICLAFGKLSLEDFLDYQKNHLDIDHIDNNPSHNNIDNLQVLAHWKNILKRDAEKAPMEGKCGELHPRSIPVVQYDMNGEFIAAWGSANLAGTTLKISQSDICKCCKGKGLSAGGYIWKYKEAI